MQPYRTPKGKGGFSSLWNDKVSPKIRRVFKKGARQRGKRNLRKEI